jgi:lipopolysaccharide/colanic/teichoic acid biosynthesis glycosyltransferase
MGRMARPACRERENLRHDSNVFPLRKDAGTERYPPSAGRSVTASFDSLATGILDRLGAAFLLLLLSPLVLGLALAVRLDSRGPAFFRCRRIGRHGREFGMLKFRKMHVGASGIALVSPKDDRFTRLGRFLAKTKLDEVPQLWNVLRGQMSLVGPRPEDPGFVRLQAEAYEAICRVRPGITGLSQLAFARESEILDPENRITHYLERILPQKINLDQLYAERRSIGMDLQILFWTIATVVFRRQLAVCRESGALNVRRRPAPAIVLEAPAAAIESVQG